MLDKWKKWVLASPSSIYQDLDCCYHMICSILKSSCICLCNATSILRLSSVWSELWWHSVWVLKLEMEEKMFQKDDQFKIFKVFLVSFRERQRLEIGSYLSKLLQAFFMKSIAEGSLSHLSLGLNGLGYLEEGDGDQKQWQ